MATKIDAYVDINGKIFASETDADLSNARIAVVEKIDDGEARMFFERVITKLLADDNIANSLLIYCRQILSSKGWGVSGVPYLTPPAPENTFVVPDGFTLWSVDRKGDDLEPRFIVLLKRDDNRGLVPLKVQGVGNTFRDAFNNALLYTRK